MSGRRILVLAMIVALVSGLVAVGCAAPAPAPAPPAPAPPAPAPPAPAPPAPAPVEVITWKMQGVDPIGTTYGKPNANLVEKIPLMSDGRLVIECYSAGAIVPAQEELRGVREGVLDIASTAACYNLDVVPTASLVEAISGGLSCAQAVMWFSPDAPGLKYVNRAFAPLEVMSVGSWVWTGEDWGYTTFPLETPSDLQKLKMRTAGDGGEILARLGASTVFIPGAEIYEAMQRGVLNAFEYGGAIAAWDMGFHEVYDYLYISPSRLGYDNCDVWVSIAPGSSWMKLTDDLQEIIRVAVQSELTRTMSEMAITDGQALVWIADYGVQVAPLPKEIEDAFLAEAYAFYDEKAAGDAFYLEVLQAQREFKVQMEFIGIY